VSNSRSQAIEARPENLIGDRTYDSDKWDEELRKDGAEMITPHRRNRVKRKAQGDRRLRRYERRWLMERFFAWIQWQCRLVVRWEYYAENVSTHPGMGCRLQDTL
jgi:transposase